MSYYSQVLNSRCAGIYTIQSKFEEKQDNKQVVKYRIWFPLARHLLVPLCRTSTLSFNWLVIYVTGQHRVNTKHTSMNNLFIGFMIIHVIMLILSAFFLNKFNNNFNKLFFSQSTQNPLFITRNLHILQTMDKQLQSWILKSWFHPENSDFIPLVNVFT